MEGWVEVRGCVHVLEPCVTVCVDVFHTPVCDSRKLGGLCRKDFILCSSARVSLEFITLSHSIRVAGVN